MSVNACQRLGLTSISYQCNAAQEQGATDGSREQVSSPLAALVSSVISPDLRRTCRRWTSGEPVGEARVCPTHHRMASANGDPEVDRGQPMSEICFAPAAAQVERRGPEQDQIHQRYTDQERRIDPRSAKQVAEDEAGYQHHSEPDFTSYDHSTPLSQYICATKHNSTFVL